MTKEQVQQIIVKIECGTEQGTGFFITPNRILTAYHVVEQLEDGEKISIAFNEQQFSARLIDNCDLDIALLEIVGFSGATIPIIYSGLDNFILAWLLGFIGSNQTLIEGKFLQIATNILLQVQIGQRNSYGGLSGSPIFANGNLVGIAQIQIVNKEIKALPINLILPFIEKNGIKLKQEIPFEKELLLNIKDLGDRYTAYLKPDTN